MHYGNKERVIAMNMHEVGWRIVKCRSIESDAKIRASKWGAESVDWHDHLTLSESRYLLECASFGVGGLADDPKRKERVSRQVALVDAKTGTSQT